MERHVFAYEAEPDLSGVLMVARRFIAGRVNDYSVTTKDTESTKIFLVIVPDDLSNTQFLIFIIIFALI